MSTETFERNDLRLEVAAREDGVYVTWLGRSTARDPSSFLAPLLFDTLTRADKNLVTLDFRRLEYMNSSTITPVIRLLHEAKKRSLRLKILYDRASRWQELSFSALTIFQTGDGRISIEAA